MISGLCRGIAPSAWAGDGADNVCNGLSRGAGKLAEAGRKLDTEVLAAFSFAAFPLAVPDGIHAHNPMISVLLRCEDTGGTQVRYVVSPYLQAAQVSGEVAHVSNVDVAFLTGADALARKGARYKPNAAGCADGKGVLEVADRKSVV